MPHDWSSKPRPFVILADISGSMGHDIRLRSSCYRLIWLNPLLGSPTYEPLTRGMQTALPYTDNFLPVHNLASLEDLAQHLQTINQNRPVRRQINMDLQ
jgi:uncharacterized protein with von Willebrand factor type A (vWA) domain